MIRGGPQQQLPDINQLAAQNKVIDAQKELAAIQYAQTVRLEKAKNAINFILLPLQTADGVIRQDPEQTPESQAARAACYKYLEAYFSTTTDFEAGIAIRDASSDPTFISPVATA